MWYGRKSKLFPILGECTIGKKHYFFKWNGKTASLISERERFSTVYTWGIRIESKEEPVTFRYRNEALHYMYCRFLDIDHYITRQENI